MAKAKSSGKSLGLSIGAVSSITGIPRPTLRYWEKPGLRVSAADNQSEVFIAAVEGKRLTFPLLKERALKAAR